MFNSQQFKTLFDYAEGMTVSRSSISTRLSKMNVEFFEKAYEYVYAEMSALYTEEELGKKQLERVNSPEQLDEYIRVARPSVWLVVGALALLLLGFGIWHMFGAPEALLTESSTSIAEQLPQETAARGGEESTGENL